jgi:hypothetical protein
MKAIKRNSPFRELGGVLFFLFFCVNSYSQTQAIEQLQLNIEKLAQFRTMLTNMYKTYSILENGYSTIKNISQDNFKMHQLFIDGLSMISPAVKKSVAIAQILEIQVKIVSEYKSTYKQVLAGKLFTESEIRELENAYDGILSKTSRNLEVLTKIITPHELQMTEAERLNSLEQLAADMKQQLTQLRGFAKQAKTVMVLRSKSKKDGELLRNSYGIAK